MSHILYRGTRLPNGDTKVEVLTVVGCKVCQSIPLPLEPSLKLRNHSPTGFEWGYAGSGPAQLALAILLHASGNQSRATAHHMQFKFQFISKLTAHWELAREDILAWLVKCPFTEMERFDQEMQDIEASENAG